ncbi:MAG: LacI family DNA-binding transcriptional regulator [Chitinophagaceae bacterium]
MDAVNLKRLARQLNLSVSTVSRALRDSYEISYETKQKVLSLAKQLNYQPNPYASSLRKHKSKTIAVVVPEIANNFFSLAINGIGSVAQEKGYHVLIYLTHEDLKLESSIIRHLQSGRVDGVLISLSSETNDITHLLELRQKGLPIVFFDRVCEEIETAKITTDDYESGFKATEHLIGRGCKKIAYLLISENLSIGIKRMQGYQDALKKHDIDFDDKLVVHGSKNNDENYVVIKNLLKRKNRPDGIFASVEKLAITTYHVCRELSLNIPQDVKIISFSNLETASLLNPSMTTITQPAYDIGKEAAAILFKALDKNKIAISNEKIMLKSELIIRESTGGN